VPQDRFLHPRLGHSDKVSLLTDLEFRVWVQYILSADDFGVMRKSAVTVQADNDHLANRPQKVVQRCLDALVKARLLRTFEHQQRVYVYQPDWQDFQRIGYPRGTSQPLPAPEQLVDCSPKTRELFKRHPLNLHETLPKDLPKIPETFSESSPPSRARETAKANGIRLTAPEKDAAAKRAALVEDDLGERGARLLERYGELYATHRHGAHYRARPNLDWTEACDLCRHWDDARLDQLATVFLTTDDSWIAGTDRSFKIFAMKASWADNRLREVESGAA